MINDPSISLQHARLMIDTGGASFSDLGSQSGSLLDDALIIGDCTIPEGSVVYLGEVSLNLTTPPAALVLNSVASYAAGEMIAKGGMGAILQAQQNAMGRLVAMKVMLKEDDAHATARFVNEARITGKLEHPNIVPVHELGVDNDERIFYTMKLVRGFTLTQVLAEVSSAIPQAIAARPLSELLIIFQKICDALAFSHARGVIHRDLKPDNIMLGDFGEVLVMDWGLAKDLQEGHTESVADDPLIPQSGGTMDGAILGTPAYMSPEQAQGRISILDQRSDIFALGAILHEILHLHPLVTGSSPLEIVQKIAQGQFDPPPTDPLPHVPGKKAPSSLSAIAAKATALDPDQRYASVADLQADLSAYQTGYATGAEEASLLTHLSLFFQRHRAMCLTVVGAILLLAASSIWFLTNVVHERNLAEVARGEAEDALALVEPARQEAERQRDVATDALGQTESARAETSRERDRALTALDRIKDMKKRADEALATLGNSDEIYAALSGLSLRSGNVEEALKSIDRALAARPREASYLVAKANLLQASGRFSTAIPIYRRALAIKPDPVVQENLELTESLAAEIGEEQRLTADIIARLNAALAAQKRASVILKETDAPQVSEKDKKPAPSETPPDPEILAFAKKLGAITELDGWSLDRIKRDKDESFTLSLKGMRGLGNEHLALLNGRKIGYLDLSQTGISDLSLLRDMPLTGLNLWRAKSIVDLSSLSQFSLTELTITGSGVTSFDDLRGMKLRRLYATSRELTDMSALSDLTELELVQLPDHLARVDVSQLTKLRNVVHNRTNLKHGYYPGEEFRKWMRLSNEQWKKWESTIRQTDAKDVRPDRLTVRDMGGIDLDLRGTNITDLSPLAKMPLHRIIIDTQTDELDVSPLQNISTLKYVLIDRARVKSLAPLVRMKSLTSLAVPNSQEGLGIFQGKKGLTHLCYSFNRQLLEPDTTVAEFFKPAPKVVTNKDEIFVRESFDKVSAVRDGWTGTILDGSAIDSVFWNADFPPYYYKPGPGGGVLTFYEPNGNGKDGYFNAPAKFLGDKSAIYGALLEFRLRRHHNGSDFIAPDIILRSKDKVLVRALKHPPYTRFTTYLIPFSADGGWKCDTLEGDAATEEVLKEVLAALTGFQIRGEYRRGHDHTDLDDLLIWKEDQTEARLQKEWKRLAELEAKLAMGRKAIIQSGETASTAMRFNWPLIWPEEGFKDGPIWLQKHRGKKAVLVISPVAKETPATLSFSLDSLSVKGRKLSFFATGWDNTDGGEIRVTHKGKTLYSGRSGSKWRYHSVTLPDDLDLSSPIVLEVHSIGWYWEHTFLHDLKISSPSVEGNE